MVLIPLLMGVLQLGLLMVAKNTVNVAALATARAGGASGGSKAAMNHALALGLVPLHVGSGKSAANVGMGDINSGNYAAVMGAALLASKGYTAAYGKITVLNPTADTYTDFGFKKPNGDIVIPVTGVFDNNQVGPKSGQTRADALLLKIEVRYCQEMVVPLIKDLVREVMTDLLKNNTSIEDMACYAMDRVPLRTQAVVRMTVPPIRKELL
jgi:hypothetical protein